MKTSKNGKTLLHYGFAFILAGWMAGCAAVTDANIDGEFSSIEDNVGTAGTDAEDVWNTNGDDMDPIIDEPPSGGWN